MNFLSPWFLAGVALIAGPIIAHLIRRVTRERQQFSAMRFLQESPPRLSKRSRIQHPLLLALRCLIVAVLAAGFARPFLRTEIPLLPGTGTPQSVVVLLDDSASMQRAGLWPAARQKITDLVASLKDGDQFVLFVASGGITEVVSRETWLKTPTSDRADLVRAALAARAPGWGPTHLDSAIETAVTQWEQMAEATDSTARKRLIVVSDFAAGARIAGLAGLPWPKNCEVTLETLKPDHVANAGLQWLGWAVGPEAAPAGAPPRNVAAPKAVARVRVVQSAGEISPSLILQLRDARSDRLLGGEQTLTVPPGQSQVALVPIPADTPDGPLKLELTGDMEAYDNTLWLVPPTPREVTLNYYGAHGSDDLRHPRFYLERATAGWKDPVVKFRAMADPVPTPAPVATKEIAVVAAPLAADQIKTLRDRLVGGGFALLLLNDPAMIETAATLAGETGWSVLIPKLAGAGAQPHALFGKIDFQHPLFAPFADPHYSNFAAIHFWMPQSVLLPASSKAVVVARFDDNSPAVIEFAVGQGRLVVWGGDWSTAASQWVTSTKFVPWLQSLFERSVGGAVRPSVAEVGDTGRLVTRAAQWRNALEAAAIYVNTAPAQPGVYDLLEEGGGARLVALQVPAAESNVMSISTDDFERLGIPLQGSAGAIAATGAGPAPKPPTGSQTSAVLEGRQKLWRWLLVAAAGLLAIESLFSYFLARRESGTPAQI
ncbi:MAG: BatA domain-containing protein [Verrucomicrobiota bacterium]